MNFLAADLAGTLLAVLLFAPPMLAPGFVMAWLADLRGFRKEPLLWQLLWALPLSAFGTPILAFLIGLYLGMGALLAVYGCLTAVALTLAWRRRDSEGALGMQVPRWLWLTGGVWLALAVLSGIDLPWGDRLYAPVWIYDHNVRSAFVGGISRHGLPAVNGVFHPGHDVLLRYHYLWFLSASTVEQLGGTLVSPRHALIAGPVWCGWALIASALLFLRYYLGKPALGRNGLWTTMLLGVAGLDVVPAFIGGVAFAISGQGWISPSAEWGSNTITSLPHAVFFEPHHMAGALACCLGFLLLIRKPTPGSVLLAALCFASTPGMSIYVALAFAPAGAWIVVTALWRKDFAAVRAWLAASVIALFLCWPYLLLIAGAPSSAEGSLVRFEVRQFFGRLDLSPPAANLVNLAALPLHYLVEAGIFTLCAVLFRKRYERHSGLLALTLVPMLVASFLRSGVIANNDLGWRAPLIPQFLVLVCFSSPVAALLFRSMTRVRFPQMQRLARAAVVLGFASLAWDFYIMRAFIPLLDHGSAPPVVWLQSQPGRRNHDLRVVYDTLSRTLPGSAVVQGNPKVGEQIYLGAYSQRQSASYGKTCGVNMGGDPEACRQLQQELLPMFNQPRKADFDGACAAWNIDVLVVVEDDPLWADRGKYLPQPPLVTTPFAEAYRCTKAKHSARR